MTVSFKFYEATQEERDCAQRLSDIVNGLAVAQPFEVLMTSWIAVKLVDGNTDGNLYDSRLAAVRHQSDEKLCAYICLKDAPGGMTPFAAFSVLQYYRAAYDMGARLPDPNARHGGTDLYIPLPNEHIQNQTMRLNRAARRRQMRGNR